MESPMNSCSADESTIQGWKKSFQLAKAQKVYVYYDPSWTAEIEIHHKDFKPFKIKEIEIGSNCGKRTELPEGLQRLNTDTPRLSVVRFTKSVFIFTPALFSPM